MPSALSSANNQGQDMSSEDKSSALAFAEEMVLSIRSKLRESAGVAAMSTDGLSVSFNQGKDGLVRQLQYWERQVQKLKGNSSGVKSIDLSGGL